MIRGALEAAVFGALAVALHLGALWQMPAGTPGAAGDGGTAAEAVALVPASPALVDAIAAMETPPAPVDVALPPPEAPRPDAAPATRPAPPAAAPPVATAPRAPVAAADRAAPPPAPDAPRRAPRVAAAPAPAMAPPRAPGGIPAIPRSAAPPPADPPRMAPTPPAPPDVPTDATAAAPPPGLATEPPPLAAPEPSRAVARSPRPSARPSALPPATARAERTPAEPATARAAPAPPRPAENAAGTGGGTTAGADRQRDTPSLSDGRRQSLLADWGGRIRSRVERRKARPRGAHATGTATVRLSVTGRGRLAAVSLVASSGHAALDAAALDAVQRAGRFPSAPDALGAGPHVFTLPIRFAR